MGTDPVEAFACCPVPGVDEITCAGSHRQMGQQQGRALAEQARRGIREVILENERIGQIKPRLVPAGVFRKAGVWLARRTVPGDVELHYPRQYDRFCGIADGAGMPVEHIWLMVFLEQQARSALRMPGCTSFALTAERTAFGEPAIARVFDLPPETKPFNALRWDRPTDRHASVQLTFPQLAGSHTGVNEPGLAIAYNLGYPRDRSGCRASITLIVQEVLERCGSVDEAIELIEELPRSGGALLTLADAAGDIAAVELTATQTVTRRAEDGCVVNSNHYQTDQTRPVDTAFGDYARFWQRRGWRWIGPSSQARLERAWALLRDRRMWDIPGLISAMADHGPEGVGSDMTICRHPPPYLTTISAVLLPARRTMLIAPGQPCCESFVSRPLRHGA